MDRSSEIPARGDTRAVIRDYHVCTQHLPGRYAPGPGRLDWANQPDPFRRFAGAQVIPLPLVPDDDTPPYAALYTPGLVAPRALDHTSLGLYFELALGITAWKEFQGVRWALRANPSSGNLHPTEGYALLPPRAVHAAHAALYHYASREHALEERCVLTTAAWRVLEAELGAGTFLVGLSSVHWREAWKYGARAYRYCQHDAGHALGTLCLAAAALGWRVALLGTLADAAVAAVLGIDRVPDFSGAEAEDPDLLAAVITGRAARSPGGLTDAAIDGVRKSTWFGRANRLSARHIEWPEIAAAERAALKPPTAMHPAPGAGVPGIPAAAVSPRGVSAAAIIRQRRSAVAMDGQTRISAAVFSAMLARTLPAYRSVPWTAADLPPRIHLCLFVHRVDGLAPGLYMLVRAPARLANLRDVCRRDFAWAPVAAVDLPLYALAHGDYRDAAMQLSCFQEIASDGAFSLAMLADFAHTIDAEGAWAYRRLFWEAGLVGQVLYLEAEAAGLRATGIGCYFDDLVHALIGLDPASDAWRSLYHFTVGGAVDDPRLMTLPAYAHLGAARLAPAAEGHDDRDP